MIRCRTKDKALDDIAWVPTRSCPTRSIAEETGPRNVASLVGVALTDVANVKVLCDGASMCAIHSRPRDRLS
jgi:hypothetical protein